MKYYRNDYVLVYIDNQPIIGNLIDILDNDKFYFKDDNGNISLISIDQIFELLSSRDTLCIDIPKNTAYINDVYKLNDQVYLVTIQNITNKST